MYLAIDIEKKHFSIEKGLFAIGCILFNNQGLILETFRVIIQNDEWDEDTKSFWNKHLDVLMALEKDAISFREAMNLFNNFNNWKFKNLTFCVSVKNNFLKSKLLKVVQLF